tara:strand:+ start:645 stop:890 length:246 start_codon:yes stop_codon:yes gene_type:complete
MKNIKQFTKAVNHINARLEFSDYEFYCINFTRTGLALQGHYSSEVVKALRINYLTKPEIDAGGYVEFKLKVSDINVTITLT